MSTLPQNFSIRELELLAVSNPNCSNMFKRLFVSTYKEFVDVLYDDLDRAIRELESNPQLHREDSEDELSGQIISLLKMVGYIASNGTTGGGNKDLTVLGKDSSWSWIGEAKIYRSITDLREGFLQLSTRYRNNDPTNACAGLLAYIFRENPTVLMSEWKAHIESMNLSGFKSSPCTRRGSLAFLTVQNHQATGLQLEVRHLGVCLYFMPQDKSGRNAKKYQKK